MATRPRSAQRSAAKGINLIAYPKLWPPAENLHGDIDAFADEHCPTSMMPESTQLQPYLGST